MAGQVQTEINCLPVENTEYRQLMDLKNKEAMKPKRETKFLDAIVPGHGAGNPGMLGSAGNFHTFIVSFMGKVVAGLVLTYVENWCAWTREGSRD